MQSIQSDLVVKLPQMQQSRMEKVALRRNVESVNSVVVWVAVISGEFFADMATVLRDGQVGGEETVEVKAVEWMENLSPT